MAAAADLVATTHDRLIADESTDWKVAFDYAYNSSLSYEKDRHGFATRDAGFNNEKMYRGRHYAEVTLRRVLKTYDYTLDGVLDGCRTAEKELRR
jgi:hypothetical protein